MKNIFSIVLSSVFFLSCNNKKTTDKTTGPDTTKVVISDKQPTGNPYEKEAIELETITPLTEEQLKVKLPATLMNTALSDYTYNATMGAALVSGAYKINDSTTINVSLYDCAGPGGAGLFNLQYAGQLGYENDNSNEYTKVIDFNGYKAIEHCKKDAPECSFTYFAGKRYLITIDSDHANADLLKQVAKALAIQ
jgi:hypothetical protein